MDCKSFLELISAAVDNRLAGDELAAFHEHGKGCSRCLYEYRMEAATKALILQRVRRAQAPGRLNQEILKGIKRQKAASRPDWLLQLVHRPFVKPAIGFALAFATVLVLLKGSTSDSSLNQASLVSNDVVTQSLANYRAVLDGRIRPQLISGETAQMESLFADITDYAVHVPKMKDCTLFGAVRNEFAGTHLAHLLYRHDREIVYMYQTCLETVLKGDKLRLSDEAKDCLTRTGWFSETEPDGQTVVLYTKGRTLCAAVAHMSKSDLLACLVSEQDRW